METFTIERLLPLISVLFLAAFSTSTLTKHVRGILFTERYESVRSHGIRLIHFASTVCYGTLFASILLIMSMSLDILYSLDILELIDGEYGLYLALLLSTVSFGVSLATLTWLHYRIWTVERKLKICEGCTDSD